MSNSHRKIVEYGDFQTPNSLVTQVINLLVEKEFNPLSIIEPTCGVGNFIKEAIISFPAVQRIYGFDINQTYVNKAIKELSIKNNGKISIEYKDFFLIEWEELLNTLPAPILFLGNLPWVTNSQLSSLGSLNVPLKSNLMDLKGIEARTGKSNFDISEWMLIRILSALNSHDASIALLVKTTVARKALHFAYKKNINLHDASMFHIDAKKYFNVSVDACLLVCELKKEKEYKEFRFYKNLSMSSDHVTVSFKNGGLVHNSLKKQSLLDLDGKCQFEWRSGIKHDASKIMELKKIGIDFQNGYGERVEIENNFIYPCFKSSDVANDRVSSPRQWVIVTQKNIGQGTQYIENEAPKTWAYLQNHYQILSNRASRIYKNQPIYAIFGVGSYSFLPWKIAISGLYKKVHFVKVGTFESKPSQFDDTVYFLSFDNEEIADAVLVLLTSSIALDYFESRIFWDSKRPITKDLLQRIDLIKIANAVGNYEILSLLNKNITQSKLF